MSSYRTTIRRRQLGLAALIGWSTAVRRCLWPLGIISCTLVISLELLISYYGVQPIYDFFSTYTTLEHRLRIALVGISWLSLCLAIAPLAGFVFRVRKSRSTSFLQDSVSERQIRNYILLSLFSSFLVMLCCPFLALKGFGYIASGVLALLAPYSLLAVVSGAGVAVAWLRGRILHDLAALDVAVLPEMSPHPEIVHLATGYLAPLIPYVERRMRKWKRVEEFLGIPSPNLMTLLVEGSEAVDMRDARPLAEFTKLGRWEGLDRLRGRLGSLAGARRRTGGYETALFSSATTAVVHLLQGLEQYLGDTAIRVVRTTWEYDTIETELEKFETRRSNVRGQKIDVLDSRREWRPIKDVVEDIGKCVEESLREGEHVIVLVSHVFNEWGTIFPTGLLYDRLERTSAPYQTTLILDGAHSLGQIPVDLTPTPRAVFVWSGHKWLFGPHATGGLIFGPSVNPDIIRAVKETVHDPFVFTEKLPALDSTDLSRRQWAGVDASRFIGLGAAIDLQEVVFRPRAEGSCIERKALLTLDIRRSFVRELEGAFKRTKIPARIWYPDSAAIKEDAERLVVAPGIVLVEFNCALAILETIAARLAARQVIVSVLNRSKRLRICLTPYLSSDDVRVAAEEIAEAVLRVSDELQAVE